LSHRQALEALLGVAKLLNLSGGPGVQWIEDVPDTRSAVFGDLIADCDMRHSWTAGYRLQLEPGIIAARDE
jgi:hypothetical protein